MAAKSWETDFRFDAIQASIRAVDEADRDDPTSHPGSYCLPLGEKPVVGLTPGKIFLIALILAFALLIGGAFLIAVSERAEEQNRKPNPLLLPAGIVMALTGFSGFFVPVMCDKFIMKWLTGARGQQLQERPGKLLCAEVSHTDRSKMTVSVNSDDHVLLLADMAEQRLLIEGVAARYQFRQADITRVEPFVFMNYIGAELTCRIDDETSLSIALARVSVSYEITRQIPILFFLRKRIRNPILDACREIADVNNADSTEW